MSHAVGNANRDELVQCPYDPIHMISKMRLPYHLIKCRKNHSGKEYQQCPYDAKHVILRHRFDDHLKSCDKKAIIEPQLVMDDERSERLFIPESNTQEIVQNFSNEWDLEAPTRSSRAIQTPAAQTIPNTSLFDDSNERNELPIRRPHTHTTTAKKTSYGQYSGFGRGRGNAIHTDNVSSISNACFGPSSYTIENVNQSADSYSGYSQLPAQSFRGRGLLAFTDQNLRRPARPAKGPVKENLAKGAS